MAGEFVVTLGDVAGLPGLFSGEYLKGRGEPRVAMVGRSNIGKSTFINALLESRLAQVSKEPGKTRAIHFYFWKEGKRVIADLPGYGFARAGHEERERWARFIEAYFKADENLERAVVLLDARHGPSESDVEAMQFLSKLKVPMTVVFSKSDTLKNQAERDRRRREGMKALAELGIGEEAVFWVSSHAKGGRVKATGSQSWLVKEFQRLERALKGESA